MSPEQPMPPPGWYADRVPGQQRWWNGEEWTSETRPDPALDPPVPDDPATFGLDEVPDGGDHNPAEGLIGPFARHHLDPIDVEPDALDDDLDGGDEHLIDADQAAVLASILDAELGDDHDDRGEDGPVAAHHNADLDDLDDDGTGNPEHHDGPMTFEEFVSAHHLEHVDHHHHDDEDAPETAISEPGDTASVEGDNDEMVDGEAGAVDTDFGAEHDPGAAGDDTPEIVVDDGGEGEAPHDGGYGYLGGPFDDPSADPASADVWAGDDPTGDQDTPLEVAFEATDEPVDEPASEVDGDQPAEEPVDAALGIEEPAGEEPVVQGAEPVFDASVFEETAGDPNWEEPAATDLDWAPPATETDPYAALLADPPGDTEPAPAFEMPAAYDPQAPSADPVPVGVEMPAADGALDELDPNHPMYLQRLREEARRAEMIREGLNPDSEVVEADAEDTARADDALARYAAQAAEAPDKTIPLHLQNLGVVEPKHGVAAPKNFDEDWDESDIDFLLPPDPDDASPGFIAGLRETLITAGVRERWKDDMFFRLVAYTVVAVVFTLVMSQLPSMLGIGG